MEVVETPLTAATTDGEAQGRLFEPENPRGGVVFFPDAGGVRPTKYEMTKHLTAAGFAVLVVDPYWRQEPYEPLDPATMFANPSDRARVMAMIDRMKTTEWIADTEVLLDVVEQRGIDTSRIGVMGWCMGGRAAFLCAVELGPRVAAVVGVHAGGLVGDSESSPHRRASAIAARMYLAVADEDRSCTPEHQTALREALDEAGVKFEMEVYVGARHGFAVPDFPVYDEVAATRSWSAAIELFGATL